MPVDDRYKRASATALVMPFMTTVHTDTTIGVDDEERLAVTWMYSGIAIAAYVAPVWVNIILEGTNADDGLPYHITGRYRTR